MVPNEDLRYHWETSRKPSSQAEALEPSLSPLSVSTIHWAPPSQSPENQYGLVDKEPSTLCAHWVMCDARNIFQPTKRESCCQNI